MKRRLMLFMAVIAIFSVVFFAGCKDDTTTEPSKTIFEIVTAYMDGNGMALTDLLTDWIIAASDIVDDLDNYYIMDIRSGDADEDDIIDYNEGHVPGAVASSYDNIVTDAASADKPIIVVCYTGQSAGHAVMALRLSGYPDAKVLKWGMSGWNSAFDSWTGNVDQLDHLNWVAAPGSIKAPETFNFPSISSDSEDGATILTARVNALLSGGFKGINSVEVLEFPEDDFVNNYWGEADVTNYGNIEGAYRINPINLENLDAEDTVITYCWTGQTSSMITAYLTVLGYDAKSLKFGANSMIYDALTEHKWTQLTVDYDYETGE
ncbi:MAG: hypothetical protein K8S23_08710 [Candidatus Cloacimonetes bacterium]|nr:hypothetical protein [Candidatus Cloacimonadota bacterium]